MEKSRNLPLGRTFPIRGKRIFVDSNYFIAFFNPTDSLHQKTQDIGKELDRKGIPLTLSNLIFLEVVTVISQRRNKQIAGEVGEYLETNPLVEIIHVDEVLHQNTWEIFKSVQQKDVSFVDCSIIACMRFEGIHELLTFDKKDFTILKKGFPFSFYPII